MGQERSETCYRPVMGDVRIDPADDADRARWAERLCTTPAQLRNAVAAVGPELDRVKRFLLVALVRRREDE